MKYILILTLSMTTIECFCQVPSIWKGNTPGHEVEWAYASNWSNNRIPDEFTDVVIPFDITLGKNYPVIRTPNVEVNSLSVIAGAQIQMDAACTIRILTSNTNLSPQTLVTTKDLEQPLVPVDTGKSTKS